MYFLKGTILTLSLFVGYLFSSGSLQSQTPSIWNFNYTGSIVNWTVPQDGLYQITAYGAQGGYNGGLGASIGGVINLSAGEVLNILVGQQGASNQVLFGGGGGGGSFVVGSNNTPLIIAGAGGGGGHGDQYGKDYPWVDSYASTNTSGYNTGYYTQPTSKKGSLFVTTAYGGTDGGGGNISTDSAAGGSEQGAGGGGFSTDGASVTSGIGGNNLHAAGGSSYLNGGAGGSGGTVNNGQVGNSGGFGGGGQGSSYGAGGGGGYSGGASGPQLATEGGSPSPGGGGGSYLDSSAAHAVMSVGNTGSGLVVISYGFNLIVGNNASNQNANFTEGNSVYDNIYAGVFSGDSNNSITVVNVGTFLEAYNNAIVGENGSANSLTVSNGGSVMNAGSGIIGLNSTAEGNSAQVTGSYSSWSIGTALLIGNSGSANSLAIQAGGQVMAAGAGAALGYNASSSNNSLLIDGTESILSSSTDLVVGFSGNSNALVISNGGTMTNGQQTYGGVIGLNAGAGNNSVVVTGQGSSWNGGGDLFVGESGAGNSLVITNGGTVINGQVSYGGVIGLNTSANNNNVLVSGTGSTWSNSVNLTIGWNGANNTMAVMAGGQVMSAQGIVGDVSSNNRAEVTGTGSTWSNNGDLIIGASGLSNSMVISNGATVANGQVNYGGIIGLNAGANNNSVLVTETGSSWNNSTNLTIGYDGSGNSMVVSGGASVVSGIVNVEGVLLNTGGSGVIGLNAGSSNNTVLITGSGSSWNNGGSLTISTAGTGNSLTIANGGSVSASSITIASQVGSSGTLNFGSLGGSDTAGSLIGPGISFGSGSGTINFNQVDTLIGAGFSGNGSLNQLGIGTTILTGTNTYSGTTTVSAGTLLANSSNALGASTVMVTNIGTLGGNGTIGGATTISSGGNLTPGSSGAGALSFSAGLTLESGSTTTFLINAPGDFTSINILGNNINFGGELIFNIASYTPTAGDAFTLFNMTGGATQSGGFSSVSAGSLFFTESGGIWSASYGDYAYQFSQSTGQLSVAVAQAVPEPSTYALLGLGVLGMLIACRRHRLG